MRWGRAALGAAAAVLATGAIAIAVAARRHWSEPCIAVAGAGAVKWSVACELKFVMAMIHVPERVIDSGRYREIAIGMSRPQVITALRTMGISQVSPDVKRDQIVTDARAVPSLREAPRLEIGDRTTVEFAGDRISAVHTGARDTPLVPELREGMSRDEALAAIARFLEAHSATVLPRPSESWVDLTATDERSRRDLDAFDVWGYGFREPQAISSIKIEFTDGRVARIRESASPVELP
jgi:hypothetical protein